LLVEIEQAQVFRVSAWACVILVAVSEMCYNLSKFLIRSFILNKTDNTQQDALHKECTLYGYTTSFEYAGKEPSTRDYLKRHDYEELPGSTSLLRYFRTTESRLAHKFCVLLTHEQNHLFLLREYNFSEFLQKYSPLAPILPEYLPYFDGQVMTKKVF
jgi:hypothetical protein